MESCYLKTFIEVVQTGSFTKAAEKLCITQSAVSRRIQHMEKQYACSLLDRSGPLLKQTEKGQRLYDKAIKILQIEQELELDMKSSEGESSLSFICTPTFGRIFLPKIMSRFVRSEPGAVNLKFFQDMPNEIRENLRRGTFEIAAIEHCPDFDLREFDTVALPRDEMVFVAASDIEFSSEHPQVEELFEHTLLSCSAGCCTRVLFERSLASKGYSKDCFKQFIEISDLDMLLKSITSEDGIAFLPLVLVAPLVKSGQFKTYRVKDFVHYRNRSLVVPSTSMDCSLANRFAKQIISYFEETHNI